MKKYLNKFKEGLVLGTGILVAFSIGTFAYSKIETVKSGDVLNADSYNELVNRVNDLEFQFEGTYQDYFDTNEVWTGKKHEGKKIYSRWVDFGTFSGAGATRAHGIEGIEKIIFVEKIFKNNGEEEFLEEGYELGVRIDTKNIKLATNSTWSSWIGWFRIEYTKIDE